MIMLDESLINLLEGFVGFVNNEVEYFFFDEDYGEGHNR